MIYIYRSQHHWRETGWRLSAHGKIAHFQKCRVCWRLKIWRPSLLYFKPSLFVHSAVQSHIFNCMFVFCQNESLTSPSPIIAYLQLRHIECALKISWLWKFETNVGDGDAARHLVLLVHGDGRSHDLVEVHAKKWSPRKITIIVQYFVHTKLSFFWLEARIIFLIGVQGHNKAGMSLTQRRSRWPRPSQRRPRSWGSWRSL